jgi:hypothetical protein
MRRQFMILAVLMPMALPVQAQEPEVAPKKLTLKAAAAPVPALKYRFLPEMRDLQPGNAAMAYLRAVNPDWYSAETSNTQWETIDKLLDMSFADFKVAKRPGVPALLSLHEVDKGARRESCDWEMLPRLRRDGFGTLVPELQYMRQLGRLLAYRARTELAKGEFEKAAFTAQTIFALSRHVGESPTLIGDLVGLAIGGMALDGIEDFIQQPDAPNLYWALTALPRPFIDLRKGLEGEKVILDSHFPELKKLDKEPLSAQELKRLGNFCADEQTLFGNQKEPSFTKKLELVGRVTQQYPAARKYLIEQGRKAEEIDALPMLQVVLAHNYQQFRRLDDDMKKWFDVPFWEGHKGRQDSEADIAANASSAYPFVNLLPAQARIHQSTARLDRRIAALRCIEALRLHVKETGKLPASLSEVGLVPIPIDAFTGKQFQYTARGDEVTLFGPPPPGAVANEGNVIHYQITIKP